MLLLGVKVMGGGRSIISLFTIVGQFSLKTFF